ncbi:uncharacterized protein LOC144881151 [Branchiostoma floridae x Branchiostoma japonicum]
MSKAPAYPTQAPPQGYAPPPGAPGYAPPAQPMQPPPYAAAGPPPPYNPHQWGPPGAAQPPQGAPPPQAPPGGYGYAPPGQTNVYIQPAAVPQVVMVTPAQKPGGPSMGYKATAAAGSALGGLVSLTGKGLNALAKGVEREINHAVDGSKVSHTLALFSTGNVLQLYSKVTQRALRVMPNGAVDALGGQEPGAQFIVTNCGSNQVILRNCANPAFHLAVVGGVTTGTGNGTDKSSIFRLSETVSKFVTLESVLCRDHHVGIAQNGMVTAPGMTKKGPPAMFSVRLVYSPFGQVQRH